MPVLPNMGLVTPTLGGDRGVWDDKVNACFALVDAHDHTAGKGLAIVTAALNINADLPANGFSITTLGKIAFSTIALPVAGSLNLFVNTADNELYWRTAGGTNVKLTANNSINVALVGGIVGDYTSVSAQVAFDDANDRYTFKQNNATGWAKMASGDVHIYEAGTGESVYVGLKAPAALAASYDITLPLVLPGAAKIVQIDNTGTLTTSGTITLDSNNNVVLSGAGYVKHGNSSRHVPVLATLWNVSAGSVSTTAGTAGTNLAVSTTAYYPVDINQSAERPQSVGVTLRAVAGGSPTYTLMAMTPSTGAFVAVSADSTTNLTAFLMAVTAPALLAGTLWLKVVTDGVTTASITDLQLTADVP